jgi:D-alanine transaminase
MTVSAPITASWNGQIMPLDDVRVPALDRGFLFGDALYEVLRVKNGRPIFWEEHHERLQSGLNAVQMRVDMPEIERQMHKLCAASVNKTGMIYLHITRGVGPRKHAFAIDATPNVLIFIQPLDAEDIRRKQQNGVSVILQPDLRWKRPDIKSSNLLPNCLAVNESVRAQASEAILVSERGQLTEGACSNLFLVIDEQIVTPPLEQRILGGVTRLKLIEMARRQGYDVIERTIDQMEIFTADEVFLTSTSIDVMPVVKIHEQLVNGGHPGKMTKTLAQSFARMMESVTGLSKAA